MTSPAGFLENEPPTPPPPLDDDAADPAGLRTAARRFNPAPYVILAGAELDISPTGNGPIVLDDLAVTWGRSEPLDQPTPATASVRLLDPTGRWAVGRELIGQQLLIGYSTPYPGETAPRRQVFFRGRITAVDLQPRSESNAVAGGMLLTLGASSLLTDLGNRVPFQDWPEETLGARAARVAAFTGGVASSVTVRNYWATPNVAPVAASEQRSILNSLTDLYASSGPDRMVYFPDDQRVYFLNRRDFPSSRTMARLWWHLPDGTYQSRESAGAYAITFGFGATENGLPGASHWLDSAAIEYGDTISKTVANRVTRVEVSHKDAGDGYASRVETALVPGTFETSIGVRSARADSQIVWNDYADLAASDLAAMLGREGAGWTIATLTVRPDLAGGFDYFEQFSQLLLSGAEQPSAFFLGRSWFSALGIRPIFGLIGGAIHYTDGGWSIDIRLLPVSTGTTRQHAIAWDEIDDGSPGLELRWYDGDNPRGLHSSLTYEDIGFVGLGLSGGAVPADRGWDEVYQQ